MWKVANAPWIGEQKRWCERESSARAKIKRLEDELWKQQSISKSQFQQRGGNAVGLLRTHGSALRDYEQELRRAKENSTQIQLDEHLDKSLIRKANLHGFHGGRILALESFGIETAKDVEMLLYKKVPGIGPVLSQRLFDWLDWLKSSLRPQLGLPESEKSRIAKRHAPVIRPLVQSIKSAISELETIEDYHRTNDAKRISEIVVTVQELAITEAYVQAMNLT